eukprot:5902978-Alexandrium_andersonii.AAC.1
MAYLPSRLLRFQVFLDQCGRPAPYCYISASHRGTSVSCGYGFHSLRDRASAAWASVPELPLPLLG